VAPTFQTRPINLPSDNPVGAPYAPLERPLSEVPLRTGTEVAALTARRELPARPALINVALPAEATLSFQGQPTSQTGTVREFESPPLGAGRNYTYDVRAAWRTEDGRLVSRSRRLTVHAGDRLTVDFNRGETPPASRTEDGQPMLRTLPLPMPRNPRPEPRD
jgi:uncharacterized protein (TIGR03000 family)